MLLYNKGTKIYGFFRVYFNIIIINVEMKSFLDAPDLRIKVGNDFVGIGISHEE